MKGHFYRCTDSLLACQGQGFKWDVCDASTLSWDTTPQQEEGVERARYYHLMSQFKAFKQTKT